MYVCVYVYIYIYMCMYISPLFEFLSHVAHHRILDRVPCAIQYVLIGVLFYTQYQYGIYVNSNLSISPTHPLSHLVSMHLFSTSVSLFLLCK